MPDVCPTLSTEIACASWGSSVTMKKVWEQPPHSQPSVASLAEVTVVGMKVCPDPEKDVIVALGLVRTVVRKVERRMRELLLSA